MTFRFDPNESFIAVLADLVVATTSHQMVMALDTGTTQTAVVPNVLATLGLDQSQPIGHFSVTTANGLVWVEEFRLDSLTALGVDMSPMDVIAMDLRSPDYEGLLGKDFFRDRVLKIDFGNGTIDVS